MTTHTQATRPTTFAGLPLTDLTMILVAVIWGVNFPVTKLTLNELSPLAFAALRFTGAALVLWIIWRVREGTKSIPLATLKKLLLLGVIGNTIYQIAFTYGIKLTSAANGSLLIAITPALVAAFGTILGIERIRRTGVIGIALAISGVVFVLLSKGLSFSRDELLGDLLMLGCAIAWTIYTLGVRSLSNELSSLSITTWSMISAVPGLLLVGLPDILRLSWGTVSLGAWSGLIFSMLLSLVLSYLLWNESVRVAGSNRTAIYGCAVPLVAALTAWPALGEVPTWLQGVGALLIISGVLLTRR